MTSTTAARAGFEIISVCSGKRTRSSAEPAIRSHDASEHHVVAQVGATHGGVDADLSRRAGRDDAAVDHDRDAVGECPDCVHVVLDQDDRLPSLERAEKTDHAL